MSCKALLAVFVVGTLLISGCASIVSKSTYPVSVSSKPEGATITITNRHGQEIHSGRTPATVSLKAGCGYFKGEEYTILFSKAGYKPFKTTITSDLDGWYVFGNIFFGGLIGWLIVDPATGAMWKLDDASAILLEDSISKNQKNDKQLNIALIAEIQEEYYNLLQAISK